MQRHIAFLRAINVGGHTVRMETLRQLFESFGFTAVETFIASGNVIFENSSQEAAALEAEIAGGLREALGYEVATFIRSAAELADIAATPAFPQAEVEAAAAYTVAFLHTPPDALAKEKLMALRTEIDNFAAHGREVYWLCQKNQSQSTFSNALLERTLGERSTLRGMTTVQKLAARVAAQSSNVGKLMG